MTDERNQSDILLQAIQKSDQRNLIGKLRVFLGMSPGVGKTYAMLEAAQEQKSRGIQVAIGVVETHSRKETEKLTIGLHVLPKKKITYRDRALEEMDLDAILSAKPQIVLVDELAHTNAPDSRHKKRFQDVEEILRAGIDVYTTVNIQHIESKNDQVAQITGVQVKETVPDSFFDLADRIEVIDLDPSELLQRLKEGKVYLGERAERAQEHFFQEEKLSALRELALRFTADRVDQDLNEQMLVKGVEGPWNTNERLLVAVSHSPYSAKIVRTAGRMSRILGAPWIALHVDNGMTISADDEKVLQANLTLAKDLGGEVITIADSDITLAIRSVCKSKNVTQIVMGRPDRRYLRDLIYGGNLLEKLVQDSGDVDIHVVRTRTLRAQKKLIRFPKLRSGFMAYYHTTWLVGAMSLFCYLLIPYLGYQALGSFFLLFILGVATISSPGPIFYSAFLSALIWNYFFIPPKFTFHISSSQDMIMVLSFFVTALVGGLLTSRIRKQEQVLRAREEKSQHLYEFVKNLASAKDKAYMIEILRLAIQQQFECESTVLLKGEDGRLNHPADFPFEENDFAVATWAYDNHKPAGWSTMTLSGSKTFCLPMKGNSNIIGVLVILPTKDQSEFSIEQKNFIETLMLQASTAIERFDFQEGSKNAEIFAASEKLHQTLINSVSHELRTPITTIIGTTSTLQNEKIFSQEKVRESLLRELSNSARRLDRVVENLLDMSRIEKNGIQLKKEWFEVRDVLEQTKHEIQSELSHHTLTIDGDVNVLIHGDFKLLQHAFANLLLNAIKFSPLKSKIHIHVSVQGNMILIEFVDEGSGIPKGYEEKLFEKFFQVPNSSNKGVGLGLSIVKNIIELHGGTISAKNRNDRIGAIFECSFPKTPIPENLKEMVS